MSNTKTIKIILNLRQLDNDNCSGGCGGAASGCGGGSCGDVVSRRGCEDPEKAIDRARERGRTCGKECDSAKPVPPACPTVKDSCPRVKDSCPTVKDPCQKPEHEAPKVECTKKKEDEVSPPKREPESPPQKRAATEEPPSKGACPQKTSPKAEACPQKTPPKTEACPQKKPPEKEACPPTEPEEKATPKMDLVDPPSKEKCSPPKYLNTDVGPDGKEQQCKQGTSTDGKCRYLKQQRKQDDDYPNPASSGGMVQFFKNKFYNSSANNADNTDVGPDGKKQQCMDGKCRYLNAERKQVDHYPYPAFSGGMFQFFKDKFYDRAQRK